MSSEYASTRRPYTFDRVVRLVISLILIGSAIWLIDYLKGVLLPFCVAWLIAYMLEPFVQFNKKLIRAKGRLWPSILTLLETFIVVTILGIIFIPSIIEEVHQLSAVVRNYATSNREISFIPRDLHVFLRHTIDFNLISDNLNKQDIQAMLNTAAKVFSSGWEVVLAIFDWILVLLYVVFIMIDYEKLSHGLKYLVPPKYRKVTFTIWNDVVESMNHYFRGQALIAVCVAIMFSVAFSIIGLPLAVLLGISIGIMSMIPYLQLTSIIPTTLLCIVMAAGGDADFWTIWTECMICYAVIQATEDLILTPHIMGKAMGLNPAIILLSLSIWGSLLGLIGMIIALPATTLILSYYERYVIKKRLIKKIA